MKVVGDGWHEKPHCLRVEAVEEKHDAAQRDRASLKPADSRLVDENVEDVDRADSGV